MGVGYLGLADRIDHTASTEYSGRQGEPIDTLQIHHAASTSDDGVRRLMDPGGRTVSANYILERDGTLVEVVPGQFRAFTSATSHDRHCLTVETVNQTGSPHWQIAEVQRERLAKLHRDMAAAGLPTTPGRRGMGGIIGHSEVPGAYDTACPGPDMHLDHIADLAASEPGTTTTEGNPDMLIIRSTAYGKPGEPAHFIAAPGALVLATNHHVINQMVQRGIPVVGDVDDEIVSDDDLNAWLFTVTGITGDELSKFDPARGEAQEFRWTAK